jgi:hypothetical protein
MNYFDRVLDAAKKASRQCMLLNGHQAPQVIFVKQGQLGLVLIANMENEGDKDVAAAALNNFRKDCEVVAFIAESWIGSDITVKPSEDPKRKEALVIVITALSGRQEVWMAEVKRNPTRVEPWVQKSGPASGRFIR